MVAVIIENHSRKREVDMIEICYSQDGVNVWWPGSDHASHYQFDKDNPEMLGFLLLDLRDELVGKDDARRKVVTVDVQHGPEYKCKDAKCEICNYKGGEICKNSIRRTAYPLRGSSQK